MSQERYVCEQCGHEGNWIEVPNAALHPVRSEPLLADAVTAICSLIEELESYTMVHGADEDDEQAIELGRDVLRKANTWLNRPEGAKERP